MTTIDLRNDDDAVNKLISALVMKYFTSARYTIRNYAASGTANLPVIECYDGDTLRLDLVLGNRIYNGSTELSCYVSTFYADNDRAIRVGLGSLASDPHIVRYGYVTEKAIILRATPREQQSGENLTNTSAFLIICKDTDGKTCIAFFSPYDLIKTTLFQSDTFIDDKTGNRWFGSNIANLIKQINDKSLTNAYRASLICAINKDGYYVSGKSIFVGNNVTGHYDLSTIPTITNGILDGVYFPSIAPFTREDSVHCNTFRNYMLNGKEYFVTSLAVVEDF